MEEEELEIAAKKKDFAAKHREEIKKTKRSSREIRK